MLHVQTIKQLISRSLKFFYKAQLKLCSALNYIKLYKCSKDSKSIQGIKLYKGKLGYRDIPKTACSTIKKALYAAEFSKKFDEQNHNGLHIHDLMNTYKDSIDTCEFRFIVVRDPIKRFLSAYSNRVLHYQELSSEFIEKNCPHLIGQIEVFNPSLSQFIQNLDLYLKVPVIKGHFQPVSTFLNKNELDYFTDVYPIESLHLLESKLSEIYSKKITFGREQTGGRKITIKELTKDELEILLKYYEEDYLLLSDFYSIDDYK